MQRRDFLTLLAAGVAAALAGCARPVPSPARTAAPTDGTPADVTETGAPPVEVPATAVPSLTGTPTTGSAPIPSPSPSFTALPVTRLPAQTAGTSRPPVNAPAVAGTARTIDRLPASGVPRLAFTVDDGVSTPVVDAFVDFILATGIRMTFFVNGVNPSWTAVQPRLAPLVESGQVQLGNHTWSHPSITELSAASITDQLQRNETFLRNRYGVNGRPYFRPPYGHHNAVTDAVTGSLGFDRTVMWFGALEDAGPVSVESLVANARTWFQPGHVVIAHANQTPITHVYGNLVEIIRERSLQTVTMRDAYGDQPYGTSAPRH